MLDVRELWVQQAAFLEGICWWLFLWELPALRESVLEKHLMGDVVAALACSAKRCGIAAVGPVTVASLRGKPKGFDLGMAGILFCRVGWCSHLLLRCGNPPPNTSNRHMPT